MFSHFFLAVAAQRKVPNGNILVECDFEDGLCANDLVFLKNEDDQTWTRGNVSNTYHF